jgi:striatin 1/3/4
MTDDGAKRVSNGLANTGKPVEEYTLPGVLFYLQSEWRSFERERNEWTLQRSQLTVFHCVPGVFRTFEN